MAKNTRLLARRTGTASAFELRKLYLSEIVPSQQYTNFYDHTVSLYYGRVDTHGNAIYPSEKYLKPLRTHQSETNKRVYALNFVADAFGDLQDYFNKAYKMNLLKDSGENSLDKIKPVSGWKSMHSLYGPHIKSLFTNMVDVYLEQPMASRGMEHSRPMNFDEFIKSTKHFHKTNGKHVGLSRSYFILSQKCSTHISGLAIDIVPNIQADQADSDSMNSFTFFDNPNFEFYMHALKKFGFMANKENPNRIIADLGSPQMQAYMANYGLMSIDDVFETYFYKASEFDYDIIRTYLVQMYNNYVVLYPTKTIITNQGTGATYQYIFNSTNDYKNNGMPSVNSIKRTPGQRGTPNVPRAQSLNRGGNGNNPNITKCRLTKTQLQERRQIAVEDLSTTYTDIYWIPLYIEMLNYELSSPMKDVDVRKTIKNAKDLYKNIDIDAAKGYIKDKINFHRYPIELLSLQK